MERGQSQYEIYEDGGIEVIKFDYTSVPFTPSLADNSMCMANTIEVLSENPQIGRLVFFQGKNYVYNFEQTMMLVEIAHIYSSLIKEKKLFDLTRYGLRKEVMQYFHINPIKLIEEVIFTYLRTNPVGAYIILKRTIRELKIRENQLNEEGKRAFGIYLTILEEILDKLEKTKLISLLMDSVAGKNPNDRDFYKRVFLPEITPDFMQTLLMATPPKNANLLDYYNIDEESNVKFYQKPNDIEILYSLTPPEFRLSEEEYKLLDYAKSILMQHQPKSEEYLDMGKIRRTFFNISKDLITDLAQHTNLKLDYTQIENLASILVRNTIGFGVIEIILKDEKIQDLVLNGPIGQTPFFIVHADYGECKTNIIPSREDAESWATKFRLISGRPLDEANPILDTELSTPDARARVAIITAPLSPWGLAYALRRHRDKPWTLPLFIKQKMLNPVAAGLISFLIDGARTMIIAGTRSAGKSSVLGSVLVEVMRKYRVLTVEDTLELPVTALKDLGYNIQPMKVRSALSSLSSEVGADEGIRTSLRLGDSALIVGEVRSVEAQSLYEAMRVGALANVVAGTIHGDSPYGVYDRVVNDLKVPKTSFKATDIIIVCNPIKSPDGLHKWRRVTQITEVRKDWEEDPLKERGFVDLMKYNPETDELEVSDELKTGESDVLKGIGQNIKEWAGNWDAIWDNIMLRAKIKETIVHLSDKYNKPILLEAEYVIPSSDMFHRISEEVNEEFGYLKSDEIYRRWLESFDALARQVKQP